MISDILTIIWKEYKEILFQGGRFRGGWLGMAFFVLVFGIFMPIQTGPGWVNSPIGLVYWAWIPFLLVSGIVADTFAGERERHTLETLLASRLSDRAILFGKLFAAILYGWGFTILSMIISLVTVNIAYGQNGLLLYPLNIGIGIFTLSFLIAGLSAGLGVLISLRASTVRQAQQTFTIAFFAIFILIFALPMLPANLQMRLVQLVSGANLSAIAAAIAVVLVILDAILIGLAMIRFRRDRLILD